MNLSAFEDHLDRHGGELSAWPAPLRAEAAAFVETSPDAAAGLRAMRDVEAFLRVRPVPASAGIEAISAIAARATRHRQEAPARRLAARIGWAAAAAVLLVLGISLGDMVASEHNDGPDHVLAAAFDTGGAVDVE